jgi:hypothetical protein
MQQKFSGAKASSFIFTATLAWAAFAGTANAIPISGQGTWETTLQARDINNDGTADAYYDTALNITWLADANLPKTQGVNNGMGVGILYASSAQSFVDNLDVYGVTGWRLSHTGNEIKDGCSISIANRCNTQPSPGDSEFAHLYYVTLGNTYGAGTKNTANFLNLGNANYLTDSVYTGPAIPPGRSAFMPFNFSNGEKSFIREDYGYAAWAVRDGDIYVSHAPEPETWAMMLAGLAGLGAYARRQKNKKA